MRGEASKQPPHEVSSSTYTQPRKTARKQLSMLLAVPPRVDGPFRRSGAPRSKQPRASVAFQAALPNLDIRHLGASQSRTSFLFPSTRRQYQKAGPI